MPIKEYVSIYKKRKNRSMKESAKRRLKEGWMDDFPREPVIKDTVEWKISTCFENLLYDPNELKKVSDVNGIFDSIESSVHYDATDVYDLDFNKQLDLCYYASQVGYIDSTINCEWENIEGTVEELSAYGLKAIVEPAIRNYLEEIDKILDDYDIEWKDLSNSDKFDTFRPSRINPIKMSSKEINAEVFEYRNIEGGIDVDIYRFHIKGYNQSFYFAKYL